MDREHFATTEAAVTAMLAVIHEHGREADVRHDIGADQSGRRVAAGAFAVTDEDGSLPHEALIEVGGSPVVDIEVYSEGDAKITVEGVTFHDVPRDSAPAFLASVFGGLAHVKGRFFPPGWWLVVPLPGDETYKRRVLGPSLTPWLSGRVRPDSRPPR